MSAKRLLFPATLIATAAFGVAVLTGCSSPAAAPQPTANVAATSSPSGAAAHYRPIVEPFSIPAKCRADGNTLQMASCVLNDVVTTDKTVDRLQRRQYLEAITDRRSAEDQAADDAWLHQRTKTCAAQRTGGTIDEITGSQCLLAASKARVKVLEAG